ncbi:MAG: flagellar M-ring protein FliF [Verrucomicrobia bacterium]|nr:flagellar M-ring protein FliF [Verrucomicrobiota bacterium]
MPAFWRSLAEIWKSLSAGQRLTLGSTALLSVAVLVGVVWWSQKPQLALLYGGLEPTEAAKIADDLRDQKVSFEISNGGRAIFVPSRMVYDLRLKLASKGIPRSSVSGGGVGFELLEKPSFGLSDFLQKANYYRALQGELARTISQMEEVENARVMIVVPNDKLFAPERAEAKASVFLKLRANAQLPRQQVNAIRFLVANGVEGLKPTHVAVVDDSGNVLAADAPEDSTTGLSASQMETRKIVETLYTTKIQSMLDQVLGPQQSVVRVSAELNFDNVTETKEQFDTEPVLKTESNSSEESQNPMRSQASGVVGINPNTPIGAGETNVNANAYVMGTTKRVTTNNQYEIGKIVQNTLKGVGEVKRLSVAVFVNKGKVEDKVALENVIKRAVGFVDEKGKRKDEFALEEFAFAAIQAAPVPKKPDMFAPEKVSAYLSWMWQALLAAGAIGLLFYFRHLLTVARAERLQTDLSIETLLADAERVTPVGQKGRPAITVSELSKLIRENPTNMAQALKTWIGET